MTRPVLTAGSVLAMVLDDAEVDVSDRIGIVCRVLEVGDPDAVLAWCYAMTERAFRVHVSSAMEAAGLSDHADAMRAVRVTDEESARAAMVAASDAYGATAGADDDASVPAAQRTVRRVARRAAGAAAGAARWAAWAHAEAAVEEAMRAALPSTQLAESRLHVAELRAIAVAQ